MSEKLKPNFTPVPNVVFDKLMRDLAPAPLKVLLTITRYTYGWGKKSDRISLRQICEMTGIADRSNVHRAIKELGKVVTVVPGDPAKNQASEYRLNVEISDTDLLSLKQQPLLSPGQQPVVRPVVTVTPIQRKSKEKDKTGDKSPLLSSPISKRRKLTRAGPAALAAFDAFYQAYPRRVGKAEALKVWTRLAPGPELVADIMAGVERYGESVKDSDPKFIKHPGPWLNGRRWEDEPTAAPGNGAGETTDSERRRKETFINA